jgi:ABC-type sugar transport system substrate-binding protein
VPAQSTVTAVSKELEDSLKDAAKKLGVSAEVQIDQRSCQTSQQQQQQQQQHPNSAVDLLTG